MKISCPSLLLAFGIILGNSGSAPAAPRPELSASLSGPHSMVVKTGERLGYPPPDPIGTVHPAMTGEAIRKDIDARLKASFETAAAHSNHQLTAQGAKGAGLGFIADHFAKIDKDRNGYATFDEVSAFMSAWSPWKKSTAKAGRGPIQIIE